MRRIRMVVVKGAMERDGGSEMQSKVQRCDESMD